METNVKPEVYEQLSKSYKRYADYCFYAFLLLCITVLLFTSPRVDPGIGARFVYVTCALFAASGCIVCSFVETLMHQKYVRAFTIGSFFH